MKQYNMERYFIYANVIFLLQIINYYSSREYSPKQFLQKRSSTVTQFERMLNRARLNEARARERAVMQSIVAPMAEDFDY